MLDASDELRLGLEIVELWPTREVSVNEKPICQKAVLRTYSSHGGCVREKENFKIGGLCTHLWCLSGIVVLRSRAWNASIIGLNFLRISDASSQVQSEYGRPSHLQ